MGTAAGKHLPGGRGLHRPGPGRPFPGFVIQHPLHRLTAAAEERQAHRQQDQTHQSFHSLTFSGEKNAVCLSSFGGDLSIDRQKNLFMKLIVKSMRNEITENGETDDIATTRVLPTVNPTEIRKLADIITGRNL